MEAVVVRPIVPPMPAVASLYAAAALRRPVRDLARMEEMFRGSNVVRSAWVGGTLAGLLRGWCDGGFDGFVSDLAVRPDFQVHGVGRALLGSLEEYGSDIQWVLLASPLALDYYQKVGWSETGTARLLARKNWNPGDPVAWRDDHLDLF